ncbi:SAM-dependent methyltransferase [Actinoalloteichus caeruleus]|uniref:SAM-dependent methyltransferase n=1 Tax=Actinoalloteichus cyanogriseus TaxID=2893586 RepID=UPI00041AE621|nr:SAM-dependent methyltransferase [Actinoalloteichus caeruleus]
MDSDGPDLARVDLGAPGLARVVDHLLGGAHSFAVDREAADVLESEIPGIRQAIHQTRSFLGRAVRYLLRRGVRQFLDLGAGLPGVGSVHEIAAASGRPARVVYVDNDPMTVAHARHMVRLVPHTAAILTDLRSPALVLDHAESRAVIDPDEPLGVLLSDALPAVPEPIGEVLDGYLDRMVDGSYLALAHPTSEGWPGDGSRSSGAWAPVVLRTAADVHALWDRLDLVPPGVVPVQDWRPDTPLDEVSQECPVPVLAGLGRVRPRV